MYCNNCGKEITEGGKFCNHCGAETVQKQGVVSEPSVSLIDRITKNSSNSISRSNSISDKKKIILVLIVCIAVIALLIYIFSINSIDGLCARGKYQKAYDKADSDKQLEIYIENVSAFVSKDIVNNLKDRDSYKLLESYYFEGDDEYCVLLVSAKNSYNATVTSYYYCINEYDEWYIKNSFSDMSRVKHYSSDNIDDMVEDLQKDMVDFVISNGEKLSDEAVDRINKLFEKRKLDDIELIQEDTEYSGEMKSTTGTKKYN